MLLYGLYHATYVVQLSKETNPRGENIPSESVYYGVLLVGYVEMNDGHTYENIVHSDKFDKNRQNIVNKNRQNNT